MSAVRAGREYPTFATMRPSRRWGTRFCVGLGLAEGGHRGVYAGADACGPAGSDGLNAGVEADAFGAVDGVVAEERALPAAEAVEGHGDRDWDVDADHAGLDGVGEGAGGVSVAGEDGGAVAVLVLVDELEGGLEGVGADDAEDGAEDLFAVDAHLGLDVVEEAGSEEEAFAARKSCGAAVDDQRCSFLGAEFDVAFDAVEVGADVGVVLGARGYLKMSDARGELVDEGVGGGVGDGDGYGDGHAALSG